MARYGLTKRVRAALLCLRNRYQITAQYSCADHIYKLQVSTPPTTQGGPMVPVVEEDYNPQGFCPTNPTNGEFCDPEQKAAQAKWPMLTFDSARIGAWFW